LSPIRIIIAPGEHDPYINDSPYERLIWPENVDIFYQSKLSHLELAPGITLWGACNPPTRGQKLFDGFHPSPGVNILLLHASENKTRNSLHTIQCDELEKIGFQLALLGGEHITHKSSSKQALCVFPGTPEPLEPATEKESHQIILVELDGEHISSQSLSIQQWHYRTVQVDISTCASNADAAHSIDDMLEKEMALISQVIITIELTGHPHFELDLSELHKLVQTQVIFRMKCRFKIDYDLEQLASEPTIRGTLVQRFLNRIHDSTDESERSKQLTALHFALQALEGKQGGLYEIKTN
jgi:exonuclease SbcD